MLCKHNYTITRCPWGCLGWQVTIHDFWCQVAICLLLYISDSCCGCIGQRLPELRSDV